MSEKEVKLAPTPIGITRFGININDTSVILTFGTTRFVANEDGSVGPEEFPEWTHSFVMSPELANELARITKEVFEQRIAEKESMTLN